MVMKTDQGLTLIEMLFALALSALTMGAVATLYLSQLRQQTLREDILDMQQHVRSAMDVIAREVSMAGYDPRGVNRDAISGNDFHGIVYDPSRLIIQADLNGNGVPTNAHEFIAYSHDRATKTLRRDTGGGRQPVAEHISAFSIAYFDDQGRPTTNSRTIRQVEVSMTGRTPRADPTYSPHEGYRSLTLRVRFTPRNLLR